MTENEAIQRMRARINIASTVVGNGVDGKAYEDMEIAIKALEEVQEYRKLGTLEELTDAIQVISESADDVDERGISIGMIKDLDELAKYRKIGKVEEVREAVEKTRAKKCIQDTCPDHTHYKCPSCGKIQMSEYRRGIRILGRITNNCDNCGQRLESEE